jgi:hypothetical protein
MPEDTPPSPLGDEGKDQHRLNVEHVIHDLEKPEIEKVRAESAVRRLMAFCVVLTLCATTIIGEAAVIFKRTSASDLAAVNTPLAGLAVAVVAFYFTRPGNT